MSYEKSIARLPLPLAQLLRRALNAKTPLGRHQAAYYAWEATIKLLASTCIVAYAELENPDPEVSGHRRNLMRPSLGQWWEFIRTLLPILADREVAGFPKLRELILGKAREDLPRTAGLDALLSKELGKGGGARNHVKITALFDHLVQYRNQALGHGATGQRPRDYYSRVGAAFEVALVEFAQHVDPMVGRSLIHVEDVRRLPSGGWMIEKLHLQGEAPRRIPAESLSAETARDQLPHPAQIYVQGTSGRLISVHPLLLFDAESGEFFFVNGRRGKKRTEYLCYSSGRVEGREELGVEQRPYVQRLLGLDASGTAEVSEAEDPNPSVEEFAEEDVGDDVTRVGEFEIISKIGQGGMGVVYRARQPSLDRQVALKCLSRVGDPKAEERFAREIAALGRVEHPNLVKIFTSGAEGDRWFYAMELVEGATLARVVDRLREHPASEIDEARWQSAVRMAFATERSQEAPVSESTEIDLASPRPTTAGETGSSVLAMAAIAAHGPLARVVDMIRQVADATHHLHLAGIVHRDIKPGNILLSQDGQHAILMDLGLAQLMDDAEGRLTRTRQFVGTLRYASPEQVLAVERLDGRSDVYALGATLWELLTLQPLFGATDKTPTPELINKIQWEEAARPSTYNTRVTPDLDAIVLKCLEKQRDRRYPSARELIEDLKRWLQGEPVLAQPPTLRYFLGKFARKHKKSVLAISASLVGLIALITVFILELRSERNIARQKADDERKARTKVELLQAEQDSALRRSQAMRVMLRARTLAPDDPALGLLLALEAAQTSDDSEVAGAIALALKNLREVRSLGPHAGPIRALDASTSGSMILTADAWTIRLWRHPFSTSERELNVTGAPFQTASLDPTARYAVGVQADGTARAWDIRTGKEAWRGKLEGGRSSRIELPSDEPGARRYLYDESRRLIAKPQFDPRAPRLAIAPRDKESEVRIIDLTGHAPDVILGGHEDRALSMAFSPDGRIIATGDSEGIVRIYDAATGAQIPAAKSFPKLHTSVYGVTSLHFAAGGRRLIAVTSRGATVWSAARQWKGRQGPRNDKAREIPHDDDELSAIAISPDGRVIVTLENNSLHVRDTRSHLRRREFALDDYSVVCACFTADGRRLALGSRTGDIHLVDPSDGKTVDVLRGHSMSITEIKSLADGQGLVSASADGTVRIWTLSTRGRVPLEAQHGEGWRALRLSPDARFLATRFEANENRRYANKTSGGLGREVELWRIDGQTTLQSMLPHGRDVTSATFSPNGRRALTTTRDGRATLWDPSTGRPLMALKGDMDEASIADFHPHAAEIVVGCADGQAWVWTTSGDPRAIPLSAHDAGLESVRYAGGGDTIVTASRLKAVTWARGDGWTPNGELRHGDDGEEVPLLHVSVNYAGTQVATCGEDGIVQLWDARTAKSLHALRHPGLRVHHAAYTPDDRALVTAASDGALRIWDPSSGALVKTVRGHGAAVRWVEFDARGHHLLSAATDGTARVWSTKDWTLERMLSCPTTRVLGAHFAPRGEAVATIESGGSVRLWDLRGDGPARVMAGGGWGADFMFSPSGTLGMRTPSERSRRLSQGGERDHTLGRVTLWDTGSGVRLFEVAGTDEHAPVIAFAPDSKHAFLASTGPESSLVDTRTWTETATVDVPAEAVLDARFTPDGKHLLTVSAWGVVVWDASTGERRHRLRHGGSSITLIDISPDSKRALTRERGERARVWDLDTGTELAGMSNDDADFYRAGFSADGSHVVAPVDQAWIQRWNAATGEEAGRIQQKDGGIRLYGLAHGARSDRVAAVTSGDAIEVYDAMKREQILHLRCHTRSDSSLALSRSGEFLAAALDDGYLHVYETATGRSVVVLEIRGADITHLRFSDDGSHLLTLAENGRVRVWPTDFRAAAVRAAPRALSEEERARYLPNAADTDGPGAAAIEARPTGDETGR